VANIQTNISDTIILIPTKNLKGKSRIKPAAAIGVHRTKKLQVKKERAMLDSIPNLKLRYRK
jgi:hypothetical protein